jgi:hypothetical protein
MALINSCHPVAARALMSNSPFQTAQAVALDNGQRRFRDLLPSDFGPDFPGSHGVCAL